MPFRYFSQIEKELFLRAKIEELRSIFNKAQKELVKKLRDIDLTDYAKYRTEALLKETQEIISELDKALEDWVEKTIPVSYKEGVEVAGARLKILKVIKEKVNFDAQIHTSAIKILTDDITSELLQTTGLMGKEITRYVRLTQQKILQDKQISKMIAEGLVTGETRRAISDKILNEFRKNMENEKFIVIKGKRYEPKYYAELVARTRTREATTHGVINTSLQYNNDLVQVSAHLTPPDVCQEYQGRVFSISGTDPDFPFLDQQPPFHPNCEHILIPVTREHLQRSLGRNYRNIIDLSKSKTPVPSFNDYEKMLEGIQ